VARAGEHDQRPRRQDPEQRIEHEAQGVKRDDEHQDTDEDTQ
jgi:hypothetical protein